MSSKFYLIFFTIILNVIARIDKRIITTLKYSKFRVKPTIVNGNPAGIGEVPFIVSIKEPVLMHSNYKVWSNLCGGSIISKFRVLTAAHCFESRKFFYANNPQYLRVVAGNLNTSILSSGDTSDIEGTQWRKIKKVIIHHQFIFPTNDIALAFIDTAWHFSENVNVIITARLFADYGSNCVSAGYGRMGFGVRSNTSSILRIAPITVMPRGICESLWEMNMDTFICTSSARTDVSEGDSGGPLTCHSTPDPREQPGRDLLVGVVSGKNYDLTTLFTRVSSYSDWISRNSAPDSWRHNNCDVINSLFIFYFLHKLYVFVEERTEIE